MRNYIVFIYLVLIALTACDRVENIPSCNDGTMIEVPLMLSIESDADSTKAVVDPSNISDITDVVRNLWIIQYNGTADNAKVLGEATYIEDFVQWSNLPQEERKIKIIATSKPCSIYLIANTFEGEGVFPVHQWSTIGDLKSRFRRVEGESDILGAQSEDQFYPMFNGIISLDKVDETISIEGTLKRNIAKLNITIKNNAPASEKLTIKSMQICSVPSVSYYITNSNHISVPFPDASVFSKVNYPEIVWDDNQTTKTITAYVPVNMRGTSESASQSGKNQYAVNGATYVVVTATYKEGEGVQEQEYPITYTFFLGENMINDYNLCANKSYNFNFTINTKGDADTDYRINDWGLVDFTDTETYEVSNCYILNPLPSGNYMRHFRIPIERVLTFWGNGSVNNYENEQYNSLRGNAPWRCFILCSDFEITPNNFAIVKGSGNSSTDTYFEVKVAPNTKGNVIIAIGPANDAAYAISWSWHLWITDYDPNECLKWGNGTDGQYMYSVSNGYVHRYEGTWWNNNKDAYIMDRNLGAYLPDVYPKDNIGLLYYQFGRKDPFFVSSVYKYPEDKKYSFIKEQGYENGVATKATVAYAVRNPLSYIQGKPAGVENIVWTYDNKYNPSDFTGNNKTIIWQDPLTATGESREGKKSIFDPCPPGFRLPNREIWSDFRSYTAANRTTNAVFDANKYTMQNAVYDYGFKSYYQIKGMQYWPYNSSNPTIPSNVVYIPAAGIMDDGSLKSHGNQDGDCWAYLWAENPHSGNNGAMLLSQTDALTVKSSTPRGRGVPVRCIRDVAQ